MDAFMAAAPRARREGGTGGRFRLPGFGGAALFLRVQVVPAGTFGTDAPQAVFDVGFLSPDAHREYLRRPCEDGFVDRLSEFLFRAADEFHPENDVPAIQDPAMGLVVTVESSDDAKVCLDVQLVVDPDAEVLEVDGVNFETSRAVLVSAAQQVRRLTRVGPAAGVPGGER